MMTNEEMLIKVIRVKGFEHRDTIWFAKWLWDCPNAPYALKLEMLDCALDDTEWDWDED